MGLENFAFLLVFSAFLNGSVRANLPIEERIQTMISDRHSVPSESAWLKLGPNAPATLIAMYLKSRSPLERTRLLYGLGWFRDSSEAREFLEDTFEKDQNSVIRQSAAISLARHYRDTAPDKLKALASDSDPRVRRALSEFQAPPQADARERVQDAREAKIERERREGREKGQVDLNSGWEGRWEGVIHFVSQDSKTQGLESRKVRLQIENRRAALFLFYENLKSPKELPLLNWRAASATSAGGYFLNPLRSGAREGIRAKKLTQGGRDLVLMNAPKSGTVLVLSRLKPSESR